MLKSDYKHYKNNYLDKCFKYSNLGLMFTLTLFLSACNSAVFTGFDTINKVKSQEIITKDCNFNELKELKYDSYNTLISIDDPIYNGNSLGYKAFLCKEFQKSIKFFDLVEDAYKDVDEKNLLAKGGSAALEIVTNENITDYDGKNYERMLTNIYKGLSYLSLSNFSAARVEMNRAGDRQRINKDKFNSEIQKRMKNLNASKEDLDKTQKLINENVTFPEFKAYKDFSNPYVSYMIGIFNILDKNERSAEFFMKEVYSQEKNEIFLQDLSLIRSNLKPNVKYKAQHLKNMQISKNGKYVWMIFDNGFSKSLKDLHFTIAIPLEVKRVDEQGNEYKEIIAKSVSFAVAGLSDGISAYDYLSLNNYKSVLLSDMDSVITTEYKEALFYNVAKAMISTTAKTIASYKLHSENPYLGLASGIFNIATNHADTRYFVGLPKNYQVARVPNIGKITIQTPTDEIIHTEDIDINSNYLVYVKAPLAGVFYVNTIKGR